MVEQSESLRNYWVYMAHYWVLKVPGKNFIMFRTYQVGRKTKI